MSRRKKTPTVAVTIAEHEMADTKEVALREARTGNMQAAAIVERLWRRQRRTIALALPPVNDATGLAAAQAEVIAATARGTLTPHEGIAWASMLDYRRRALDTVEYEQRLREIEKENEERNRREQERR